jgi:outer membrane protein assembly factor BamE (lipoprotein component of BamABCDE complex)
MKTLKLHHLLIAGSLLLASCSTVNYLGDQYPSTIQTDVYYDAKDIKQAYKVIGHLSTGNYSSRPEGMKKTLLVKAKAIGADGIIILQTTANNEMVRADAIKYETK